MRQRVVFCSLPEMQGCRQSVAVSPSVGNQRRCLLPTLSLPVCSGPPVGSLRDHHVRVKQAWGRTSCARRKATREARYATASGLRRKSLGT